MSKIITIPRQLTQAERAELDEIAEVLETLKKQYDETITELSYGVIVQDKNFLNDMNTFYQTYNEYNDVKESIKNQIISYKTKVEEDAFQNVVSIMQRAMPPRKLTQDELTQLEKDVEVMETLKKQFDETIAELSYEVIARDKDFLNDMGNFYQSYNEFYRLKSLIFIKNL